MSATRDKLINAAIELMLKSGYHAVSVDDICRRADVKKGTFYHFFVSKEALTLQAMDYRHQESRKACDSIFSSEFSPTERFQNLFDYIYQTQVDLYKKLGHVCGTLPVTLGSEMACHDDIGKKASEIICFYEKYYKSALIDLMTSVDIYNDPNIDIDDICSNVNCYIIGKITIARIRNSLDFLQDFSEGISSLVGFDLAKA